MRTSSIARHNNGYESDEELNTTNFLQRRIQLQMQFESDNENKKTPKLCFWRMGVMLSASLTLTLTLTLVTLKLCSCLISLKVLWVNLACVIGIIVWSFVVYYKSME